MVMSENERGISMQKDKYSEHFLMNVESVIAYCKEYLKFFDDEEKVEAYEIGDGNINYVFRIMNPSTKKSIVIKQADCFLRSSGRPLDLYRNKIEAEILRLENELAPGFVPKIIDYNENMCALAMEDISDYKNLRKQLLEEIMIPNLSEHISSFLAKTLLPTTDLVLDRHVKKEKASLFTNIELCDISEDLVFTEPYYNYKNRNNITIGNEKFVKTFLYEDEDLKAEVGQLRNNFMNHSQALIHGDLHSGSIFVNENGMKVIDPEFAFYGPMGYDIGNVVGNLFFALANKIYLHPEAIEFIQWLEKCIVDILNKTMEKISKEYDCLVTFPLYKGKFKDVYLRSIFEDSIGYAGTEIIRRTVGDSQVEEVTSVQDNTKRIVLDRILLCTGIAFIKRRKTILSANTVIDIFKGVVRKYGIRK